MPKVLRICQVLLCLCFLSSWANASTIVLDSGLMVMGKIIYRTPTRITIDVEGSPETFFLGEVRSIDGQTIEIPQVKRQIPVGPGTYAQAGTKTIVVPYYEGEEDSLIRFMNVLKQQSVPSKTLTVSKKVTGISATAPRSKNWDIQAKPIAREHFAKPNAKGNSAKPAPSALSKQAMPTAPVQKIPTAAVMENTETLNTNKNILTTADGGIIVVSQAKITKFDKDLNVVKEVSLNQVP